MSQSWTKSVNQPPVSVRIDDITQYVISIDWAEEAPIDIFYKTTRDIIQVAQPAFLAGHPSMGSLFLVGVVSATENYFRDIFSRIIHICPKAKKKSANQSINLGSVIWHSGINVERGAFEHKSFACAKTIRTTCTDFLDYPLKQNGLAASILNEYENVCELRHGIVHSNSILAGKNALKLLIKPTPLKVAKIQIDYPQIQECTLICTTLVTSFNLELFEEMGKRWAVEWHTSYSNKELNSLFNKLWNIFYSQIDASSGTIVKSLTPAKCKNMIKKAYNVS